MPPRPLIQYDLPGSLNGLNPADEIWLEPVPLSRKSVLSAASSFSGSGKFVSYGDYFTAVRAFIENNDFQVLTGAASRLLGRPISARDIDTISICLEKHGEFYHPARIEVRIGNSPLFFVVNMGVSPAGRKTIQNEYALLKRLGRQFTADFIPEIYGTFTAKTSSGFSLPMFLGQWFDGFHEFHLSGDPVNPSAKLKIWDTPTGHRFLTPGQSQDIYRHAAMILTYYYNIETFEQIFSWHHAAGDFIIKPLDGDTVAMKLVTVRRYGPLFENVAQTPTAVVDALLIFFLNLSLRNRLDRIDGTGDLAWAGDAAVIGTLDGFFQGLELKARAGEVPDDFPNLFRKYLNGYSETELYDLICSIADRYPASAREISLIRSMLKKHVSSVLSGVRHP